MKAIHALIPAQRISKVVMAMQTTGVFPGLTLAEARRIGPDAASGIGGIADRLMDPTPFVKLEVVCPDEHAEQLLLAIQNNTDADRDGPRIYLFNVETHERIST